MYVNRRIHRNYSFVEHVRKIRYALDNECFKTDVERMDKQLNLKLVEEEAMDDRAVQGDVKLFMELGKEGPREHYNGDHKMRVNHYDVGECPSCEDGRMTVVSKKPAFGKSNHACECDKCGYVENR